MFSNIAIDITKKIPINNKRDFIFSIYTSLPYNKEKINV